MLHSSYAREWPFLEVCPEVVRGEGRREAERGEWESTGTDPESLVTNTCKSEKKMTGYTIRLLEHFGQHGVTEMESR